MKKINFCLFFIYFGNLFLKKVFIYIKRINFEIMKKILDNLIINIFNNIYKFQQKKHQKRMQKLKNSILSGDIAGEKFYSSTNATLTIKNNSDVEKKANKEKIESLINSVLKNSKDDPKKLYDYIRQAKTKVYILKYADKFLNLIKEKEGFIYPKKGFSALYLNLILEHKISFKTDELFVLRSYDINLYAYIYQFYNWYCYKMKLKGYEEDTQNKFKNVFDICETDKINLLSPEEILTLKGAIRRDIEAINFVLDFVKNKKIAKRNHDKIKQGVAIRV